jgi:hypothetical protein
MSAVIPDPATPILDTEARVLSEGLNVSPGTARAMLRLMMARLDSQTLRALRIETVLLDQQALPAPQSFDPARLYNARPGSRFETVLPGMLIPNDLASPVSGAPRVLAGMVLEALSLLLTGQAQILRQDDSDTLTLFSSVGKDSSREVCRLTGEGTFTVTPSSVRPVTTALHVALLTLGVAFSGPLFPEVVETWAAVIERAGGAGMTNLPMSEDELRASGHLIEHELIQTCATLARAIERSSVVIANPASDVQINGVDLTLDLLSSNEFPWSPEVWASPAPSRSVRRED